AAKPRVAEGSDTSPTVLAPKGKDFSLAVSLPKFLAAQMDPASGTLLLALADGTLRQYSYPDFKLKREYRLADGLAGYPAAFDGTRDLLYLATAKAEKLESLDSDNPEDRTESVGSILIYNVAHLPDTQTNFAIELKPAATLKSDALVRKMMLAP